MKKSVLRIASLLTTAALALTACGSGDDESSEPLDSVSIGVFPGSVLSLPAYIGDREGLFDKHGVDVSFVEGKSGPEILSALIGGSTDVAVMAGSVLISALQQGQDVRSIPLFAGIDMTIAATPGSGITDLESLLGKKISITARGGAGEMFVHELLRENGLDPSDVEYVAAGPLANQIPLLRKGDADAVVLGYTSQAVFESEGIDLVTIADPRDGTAGQVAEYGVGSLWVTNGKQAGRMSKVCAAFKDIQAWIADPANAEEGAKLLAEITGVPEEHAAQLWTDEAQELWRTEVSDEEWKDNVAWVNSSTDSDGKDVAPTSACE
ncbi:ABC transporter substrate-binding protein [Nocardioides alcanivorans]|uniref:ABC transporter substrate-binding protein n=1 Tax=Nocardioides alcanivorans TaxID=2897352 RepID=UPI001F422E89|nr:ABC transporter substrate-binding protein [Nocardioides alcanivorans]